MPYKNPKDRNRRARERYRAKRHSQGRPVIPRQLSPEQKLIKRFRITNHSDLLKLLDQCIHDLRLEHKEAMSTRYRTIGHLIGIYLKVTERGELVKRMEELEKLLLREVVA